jgi:predicted O-linked N-acetylglucosamine transferase (SPINDLY family)
MMNPAETRFAQQFSQAQTLQQQGQLASARRIYQEILDAEPHHYDALNAMGVLAGQSKDLQQAILYFERAIAIQPGNSGTHCNRGLALNQLHLPDAALACFDRAIALDPNSEIAHYSRAETCKDLGRIDEALASYDKAIVINPGFAQAAYRRGVTLQQSARPAEAIASYDQVIRINPDHVNARVNKAFSLLALGRDSEALVSCDEGIALKPGRASAYLLRANVLKALDRREAALASYEQAISINPDDAEAHCNRGALLLLLVKIDEAITGFDRAIAINPDYAEAYFHRGYSRRMLNRFDSAAADYKVVANLAPDFEFLPGTRLEASLQVCDWSDFDVLMKQIAAGIENDARVAHPFIFMALMDSARLQLKEARTWVSHACPANDSLGPMAPRTRPQKVTVGYFSADLHEHPVGRLLADLIEIHDRSRFEVIAFSFGPKTHDELQQRLARAFDNSIEVGGKSDVEIASMARSLNVDIAVDLGGYTYASRAGIFALRAAPVQVSYLGYLGTMGASYIDYIVADRTVVTAESESHYSEKIIYLPDSHQVNDGKRRIADKVFTREDLGLPPKGFVFCCFNNSYKILPEVFDRWMRILSRTGNSVLWLQQANATVAGNLRREAARRGIDAGRLIFADRMASLDEHLARLRAADLFLDTFPYNAHATALDALWAGVPLLTYPGESFASRVAASLVRTIGVPELVTSTPQQYEQLAIELTLNPQRLAGIRARIHNNRLTSSLFDTPRFARNLEAAYMAIHNRYQAGLSPDHIRF